MSFDEIIYKNEKTAYIEMHNLKGCSSYYPEEDVLKLSNSLSNNTNIKEKKTVRFPEDDTLISDYFIIKSYWEEFGLCSSDEIMSLYKKACEFYNIKPIQIIIELLREIVISNCNERYDILNLSNTKLSLKYIESIEEIFKHIQFNTLNFENATLDDDSVASLFEMIEFYQSCTKLNLSNNGKISHGGFNAFARMLKMTPCLESVELRGIMFTDSMLSPLNRALRLSTNLKILHLENSNINCKNLLLLTSALKINEHLRELYLSGNRIVPSDGVQLGSLLKVNRHLKTLDVRNNFLGDVGLSHICSGLFEEFPTENDEEGLVTLILWNNSISSAGMTCLSRGIKFTQTLKSLNLGNNPILNEGILILQDGLLANQSLLRLSLPNCKLTCEGGIAIAEYLAETQQLMRLDIRSNDIRTAGLMALSLSMKVNTSIIWLDIDSTPKKDSNKTFFETQSESLRIIKERVQENTKLSFEQQELELLQSFSSLSTVPGNESEFVSSNLVSQPDYNSSSHEYVLLHQQSEEIEPSSHDSNTDVDVTSSHLPLDLTFDEDPSLIFFNDFFTNMSSPTDTVLNLENQLEELDWDHTDQIEPVASNSDATVDFIEFPVQSQFVDEFDNS